MKDEAEPCVRVQSCSAEGSRKGPRDASARPLSPQPFKKKNKGGFILGTIGAADRSHDGILSVIDR